MERYMRDIGRHWVKEMRERETGRDGMGVRETRGRGRET